MIATSNVFRALGHVFAVRSEHSLLIEYLDTLFRGLRVDGAPQAVYTFVDHGSEADPRYQLFRDDVLVQTSALAWRALGALIGDVNREAVAKTVNSAVVLHAGGVRCTAGVIALPGRSGAGKTTMVAGLLQEGMQYLTDEALAIDARTLSTQAYPKPLSIEAGSQPILQDFAPEVPTELQHFLTDQWQVPVPEDRVGSVATLEPPAIFVAPRFEAGAETAIEPVSAAWMVKHLAECCFHFDARARRNLEVLAAVVQQARPYVLHYSDLRTACRLISAEATGTGQGRIDLDPIRP